MIGLLFKLSCLCMLDAALGVGGKINRLVCGCGLFAIALICVLVQALRGCFDCWPHLIGNHCCHLGSLVPFPRY